MIASCSLLWHIIFLSTLFSSTATSDESAAAKPNIVTERINTSKGLNNKNKDVGEASSTNSSSDPSHIDLLSQVFGAEVTGRNPSKITPRKGVNSTQVNNEISANESLSKSNNTFNVTEVQESHNNFNSTYVVPHTSANGTTSPNHTTSTHHKPLKLSNEALDKMEMIADVPLRIKASGKKTSSRQPGMVMPIVITILVVPMFAVLGYMGLRRGQEAWKNRHYKRMDFLLDGMYNE